MDNTPGRIARLVNGFAGRARRLESHLGELADRSLQLMASSGARDPVEVAHAIVDAVERQVLPAGRDQCLFPFNDVRVLVVGPGREARARYEAVFDGEFPLRARILERLHAVGCRVHELTVTVDYTSRAKPGWTAPDFHLMFDRVGRSASIPTAAISGPVIDLTVTRGAAEQPAYSLSDMRIDLGRCPEVRDSRQRLIRTNQVVFLDTGEAVNQSVSRRHAHIEADGEERRLYDDGSAHGTSVVRLGRTIPVPTGGRGVKLRSGDEILLGDARLEIVLRHPNA
jgi:hypothetical protein